MKKVLMVVLAVLMILPLAVSCGGGREGNPVVVSNVYVIDNSGEAPVTLFGSEGETLTAIVEEGAELTVRDIVDAYHDDIAGGFYDEDAHAYTKLGDLGENSEFFWNYKVNGVDSGLNTKVAEGAKVEIVYEKK
ncbi:MAG: hypothetical protein IJC84_06055 [Clostridia bacterium]|nr:hypothetical protein [Clostridia bacterium]